MYRSDVSSNVGAAMANALILDLEEMGLLKLIDGISVASIMLDKSKLDRQKNKMKAKSDDHQSDGVKNLLCIGVDGKVDKKTLKYDEMEINGEIKIKKNKGDEHHLTFTKEPGTETGTYLTHRVVPIKGATGDVCADHVLSVLQEFDSVDSITGIMVDNTAVNTAKDKGIVAQLEKKIKRKLHVIGCSLHQNELPMRHVFKSKDGTTKSPNSFSGPIGKLCEKDVHDEPQVNFTVIKGPLEDTVFPDDVLDDLSSDQRILLEYVRGIAKGYVDARWLHQKIGPLNHARWLTLAIRILSLYVRGLVPDDEAIYALAKYVVQVYAPGWFQIKLSSKFHHQQKYVWDLIQRTKLQDDSVIAVVKNNLQYNSFCLLPENMLYSMLMSDDICVREEALKLILSLREKPSTAPRINWISKDYNFDANNWWEMVDLKLKGVGEPAATIRYSTEELRSSLMTGEKLSLPILPSHAQSVERAVKLTSEASACVYGQERRHQHIQAKTLRSLI